MSMPTFSSLEVQFFAEDEHVTVTPNFEGQEIKLVSGTYGPFRAGKAISIPLWMALALKKRMKCRMYPPDWLSLNHLADVRNVEKDADNEENFSDLPPRYIEIAMLLLDHAPDDIPDGVKLRSILDDVVELRSTKVRRSLRGLTGYQSGFEVTNLSGMEINNIRPSVCGSLNELFRLERAAVPGEELAASMTTQSQPSEPRTLSNTDEFVPDDWD